ITRSAESVARIAEKMSPLHQTLVSWDSDTGMPYLRSFQVGGYPCPALHSLSVDTDTEPPVAAMMWYESGDSDAECTYTVSGVQKPLSYIFQTAESRVMPYTPACVVTGTPISLATSNVAFSGNSWSSPGMSKAIANPRMSPLPSNRRA